MTTREVSSLSDVKVGDRVSIDSFKVGQPRREGTVEDVTEGLSGIRYQIRWEDGHTSSFSPQGGNLIVEKRARASSKSSAKKSSAKKSSSGAKKGSSKKASAKKGSTKKGSTKKKS